jgi:hypothetical protein
MRLGTRLAYILATERAGPPISTTVPESGDLDLAIPRT